MASNSRYGGLGKPESVETPGFEEDTMQAIKSLHTNYTSACRRAIGGKGNWYHNEQLVDALYDEAVMMLLKTGIRGYDSQQVADHIRSSDTGYADGLFLSAILNTTETEELAIYGPPTPVHIGYRLGKGKRLILGRNTEGEVAGKYSMGNIIHLGKVPYLASSAEGGVCINAGEAHSIGYHADGGIFINLKKTDDMGWFASGVHINFGHVGTFYYGSSRANGIGVNFSETLRAMSTGRHRLLYSSRKIKSHDYTSFFDRWSDTTMFILGNKLKRMSKEALAFTDVSDAEAVEAARSFDFDRLKKRVEEAAKAMGERAEIFRRQNI